MYPFVKTVRLHSHNVHYIRVSGFAIRKLLALKLIEDVRVSNSPLDPNLPISFIVGKSYMKRKFQDWDSLVQLAQAKFNTIRLFYWLEYETIESIQKYYSGVLKNNS